VIKCDSFLNKARTENSWIGVQKIVEYNIYITSLKYVVPGVITFIWKSVIVVVFLILYCTLAIQLSLSCWFTPVMHLLFCTDM